MRISNDSRGTKAAVPKVIDIEIVSTSCFILTRLHAHNRNCCDANTAFRRVRIGFVRVAEKMMSMEGE